MKENIIVFKYGGNAMTNQNLKSKIVENICSLKDKGYQVVIVHGGGPFIKQTLEKVNIDSEFIDGQRKTTPEAMEYVEMALKGKVNGSLISIINAMGHKAVGLSGKDGHTVTAKKRLHQHTKNGKTELVDLGQVGDVENVDASLIELLLENDFIPVITCIASDKKGIDYNINGDLFAGHIAGALSAEQYIILTDVDGLRLDKDNPASLIHELKVAEINHLKEIKCIQGGMIPKIDSCEIALEKGAKLARIINGTVPEQIASLFEKKEVGTAISA
ncbi:MAG: acetylglutamate kinase [Bacteroidales bacterium]|nr:acetylglutamate kinase [Bacteroidales bacterium]MCF8455231.1 acetylglutamate kinase [Bacteroidales bacterium]